MASFDDDLPGGSGYLDVSSLFLNAVPELTLEQMLMMKNFTLHDAMMAIEVMDPRMDSGVEKTDFPRAHFDPSAPLLPDEVCWIMDRMFAAEMSWHAGSAFSQSIYTCLYVHEISPGRMWSGSAIANVSQLPSGSYQSWHLVNIVLRAAVYGLLKTCDLAWRELTKGHVNEMEDFNGEKADRFICETIPEAEVLRMLDAAKAWLLSKQAASITWRAELVARIELRRSVLLSLCYSLPTELRHFEIALRQAQAHLRDIHALKRPSLEPTSVAYSAFDPSIHRRLLSVMPTKMIHLTDQVTAWDQYRQFLNGMKEIGAMSACSSILEIKELLDLRAYQPPSPNRTGIVRSRSRTVLLDTLGQSWSNRLFEAMANVPPPVNIPYFPLSFGRQNPPPKIQAYIEKMVDEYFASFFSNRPRQRRRLCNWMSEFAPVARQLESFIALQNAANVQALQRQLLALSVLRLMGACHIVLSGLELDLHEPDELSFVYWYGECLHNALGNALEVLKAECANAPSTVNYLSSERAWVGILSKFFKAACAVSLLFRRPLREVGAEREETNLRRRFKWAFDPPPQPSNANVHMHEISRLDTSFSPNLEEWKAVREQIGARTMDAQLALCSDMFHRLEEATRLYESILLLRRGMVTTDGPSVSQTYPDRLDVSGSVQSRSWALRLNIVRGLQEVATTNFKSLSNLGTSEVSRGNSVAEGDGKAAEEDQELLLEPLSESTGPVPGSGASSASALLNELQIRSGGWFPIIARKDTP